MIEIVTLIILVLGLLANQLVVGNTNNRVREMEEQVRAIHDEVRIIEAHLTRLGLINEG